MDSFFFYSSRLHEVQFQGPLKPLVPVSVHGRQGRVVGISFPHHSSVNRASCLFLKVEGARELHLARLRPRAGCVCINHCNFFLMDGGSLSGGGGHCPGPAYDKSWLPQHLKEEGVQVLVDNVLQSMSTLSSVLALSRSTARSRIIKTRQAVELALRDDTSSLKERQTFLDTNKALDLMEEDLTTSFERLEKAAGDHTERMKKVKRLLSGQGSCQAFQQLS